MRICTSSTLEDAVYLHSGFIMIKAEHVEPPEGASQYMLLSYSSVDCKRSETSASNKCKVASIYSIVSTGVHSGMWIPKDRWHGRSHNHAKPNRLANETNLK